MMATERTVAVFVEKGWYDETLRYLIDMPRSTSTHGADHEATVM
jgi:hypothetical protein